MVWNHEKRIVFIHIPKTGGTTIEYHLDLLKPKNGYGLNQNNHACQHFLYYEYYNILGPKKYNKYFKFSIVRNPIDRIVSEYYWTPLDLGHKNGKTFEEFLKNVELIIKNKSFYITEYHDHFIPQSNFILDKNNRLMVDKVYRFEKMNEIEKYIIKLGKKNKKKIKRMQKNKNKEYIFKRYKPNKKQIQKIYELYKRDFINFNYSI
jgi:chondroitin 4-sulfotransferase 11